MDCFSQMRNLTLSLSSPEYRCNIQEYEKTADKALRNIYSIYNEIMSPKTYDSENSENPYTYEEEENISHSYTMQNHYLKTCCNSLKELCVKCDKLISQCTSCNQCKCCASDKNLSRNSCKKKSDDYYTSNEQHFELKCTIPKPFTLCAKIEEYQKAKENKISKIRQDREREMENELKIRASFKPVPKSTHLPLYNQMVQEEEQRKVKRKEKCQEKLNNTKPFNLHSSSKNSTKTKSTTDLISSEDTQFKAKPIPKHILSNKISEKLKNKDEIRKLLISERAKQTIEKSALPFSQKTIPCMRSCVDLHSLSKTQNKEESKARNISEITKRLYVKRCSETMENWNKKVLQVNTDKEKINHTVYNPLNDYMSFNNKQLSKKEELPFMYFPVRMSNASLLREKQIREEITARKEKENMKDEEVIKKRFNNDILLKLKNLVPSSEGEKEIEEKVKNFRISQIKRQQEYEKELEEILKKVSEQNLLLERQSKVQIKLIESNRSNFDKENVSDTDQTLQSVASDSNIDSSDSDVDSSKS